MSVERLCTFELCYGFYFFGFNFPVFFFFWNGILLNEVFYFKLLFDMLFIKNQ